MVCEEEKVDTKSSEDQKAREFFSDLVTHINLTEFLYSNKYMGEKEFEMWNSAINKNFDPMMIYNRKSSNLFCIQKAFKEFIVALKSEKDAKIKKLAVETSGSKLLVWAEVEDDDRASLRSILYADSVANLKIDELGYSISTTVVETSDEVPVPSHYVLILPHADK